MSYQPPLNDFDPGPVFTPRLINTDEGLHQTLLEVAEDHDSLCICEKRREFGHHLSYEQLKVSARSCRMCSVFEKAVLAIATGGLPRLFQAPGTEAEQKRVLETITLDPLFQWRVPMAERHPNMTVDGKSMSILIFQDKDEDTHSTCHGREFIRESFFGPRTDSEIAFRKASNWLSTCLGSHSCGANVQSNSPTRLISVRKSSPNVEDAVRLIKTDGSEGAYACLSYRWGDKSQRQLLTTVRTLDKHMKGIHYKELPKTFQDAVTITRRMGLDYLWIDALCIIQAFDGMTDAEWQRTRVDVMQEISQMARIYQGCQFSISADTSTSMDSGIFSKLPIIYQLPPVVDDNGRPMSLHIRGEPNHDTSPTELETRGWTFQEYLLPPRVIHFGDFDIIWRCREILACECGRITGTSQKRERMASVTRPIPDDANGILEYWENVVYFYSSRVLTNGDDKLPGVAGVAQYFQRKTNWVYLAGLWQQSLLHDLCWYIVRETSTSQSEIGIGTRPKQYRAPSWSWASIDNLDGATCCTWASGKFYLHPRGGSRGQIPACTIDDVSCRTEGSSPTGMVEYGHIDISGALITANLAADETKDVPWTLVNIGDGTDVLQCMTDCKLDEEGLKYGDEVYCMPIQEGLHEGGSNRVCLILKRKPNTNGPPEYQRIGLCVLIRCNPAPDEQQLRIEQFGPRRMRRDLGKPEFAKVVEAFSFQQESKDITKVRII
ncbi:hypothetical protein PT974_10394 [Cladobotryum mycophilum]|uniref:Heterokaryon incompatibility domain-containing protein n=1 Tax=Cladobotryum mycophilum TaxID=491253 RepID=A0ABR0S9R2_9HYPO